MSQKDSHISCSAEDLPAFLRGFVRHNTYNALVALAGLVIAEVSDPCIRLLGYTNREELIGRSLSEFTTAETFQIMQERAALRIASRQPTDPYLYEIFTKDERRVLIEANVLPWPENPFFAVAVVRDVTQREDKLRQLSQREQLYRLIADALPIGILLEDALGRGNYTNEQMSLITGYSTEEILRGVTMIEHPVGSERFEHWTHVRNVLSGYDYRTRLIRKDGSKIWVSISWKPLVDERGNIQGIVNAFLDVTQRVQAEEALRESENALRSFLDALQHPASLADKSGRILITNSALARRFGLDKEELKGINLFRKLPPEIRKHRKKYFRRVIQTGNPTAFEDEREGYTFAHYLNPILNDKGQVERVAWIAIDITERKNAERALREEERRWRALIKNIPGTVMRRVINTDPPTIDFASQAVERLTGWPSEHFVGKPVSEFNNIIHPDDREVVENTISESINNRKPFVVVYRLRCRDGSIKTCRERGQPIVDDSRSPVYIDSVIFDITDLQKAERDLRESEEKYRSIVDNSKDLIMLAKPTGEIVYSNPALEPMLGYRPEEFDHLTLDIIHPDDREKVSEAIRHGCAGKSGTNFEYRFITRSGQVKWVSHSWSPIEHNGELILIVSVIRDITEKRMAEERMRLANMELNRAYQLQNQFLNSVTHEIRTPMTAVKGYAETLLDEIAGPLNNDQREIVRKIIVGADNLIDLVENLLEVARLKTGRVVLRLKACKPGDLLSRAVSLIMPQAIKKGLTVDFQINGHDRVGIYDQEKVSTILNNLLSNAVKFTSKGFIGAQITSRDDGFEAIIVDSGPGIKAKDLPSIFEPFAQLDYTSYPGRHKAPGFGLGLSIVSSMVNVLGGSLVVSSRRGIGTAFTLHIPSIHAIREWTGDSDPTEST
ncbi:MAG: PAS domain S-box protein [Armatimonadota bacterium]